MIDPQLLQLLMGGRSDPQIQPMSGLGGGTPLSGLMLGEQGMGFGGGGGMLSGQGGSVSQPEGVPDISQLLAMLQAASGTPTGVGFGGGQDLGHGGGGALGAGFGSGGQLLPPQMGLPQGIIGQDGGVSGTQSGSQVASQTLGTIKELLGLGRTIGGMLSSPTGGGARSVPTTPTTASPIVSDRTFPPEQFNLGQLMTAGDALPEFPAGAAGQAGLGGGTFSPQGNILPGLPSPTEFLGPGGSPAGAGELGPAAGQGGQTGNVFGGTGGFGAGLGALGGVAGALTAPNDISRAGSALAAAASLASFFDPTGISEILALIGGGTGLFGGLFGGEHTKGSTIMLPGFSEPVTTHTAGGTQTLLKSFQEGQGAISPFEQAIQSAQTPEALLAALNQQYSPIPGQFRVESHIGPPGTSWADPRYNAFNLGMTPFAPTVPQWSQAALTNPDLIRNLTIQAGALGAPAEQTGLEQSLRDLLLSRIA